MAGSDVGIGALPDPDRHEHFRRSKHQRSEVEGVEADHAGGAKSPQLGRTGQPVIIGVSDDEAAEDEEQVHREIGPRQEIG